LESFLGVPRKVYRGWKAPNKPPEEVGGPEVIQGGTPGALMKPEIRKNKK